MADSDESGNTPPANNPANTPVAPATPSQLPQVAPPETVILEKSVYAELNRKAAVAETAQREKAGLEVKLNGLLRRKVPALPPLEAQAVATVREKVSRAVLNDLKYVPLLQRNPTLAKVLTKNPLDLLDQDEFLDEQDATNQVLDYLDGELGKVTPVITAPEIPLTPSAPAPRSVNPSDDVQPTDTPSEKEKKEQAERNARLPAEKRIENSIASRLNIS